MGQIVIPKHTADLEEIFAALKIYYEADGWLQNSEHTAALKLLIGADQYPSSYPKKAQLLSYFGFTEWNVSKSSERRITELGRAFYEHYASNSQDELFEDIMKALENTTFGRNNKGVESSDSDVEPPNLLMRAILDLGYITNREYSYFLWKLAVGGGNYSDVKDEIKERREHNITDIPEEAAQPAYTDLKIILFLVRLGFLVSDATNGKRTFLNQKVKEKYENRIRNLKIFNVDKNVTDDVTSDANTFVFNFNDIDVVTDPIPSNLSIDDLGRILADMYNNASAGNQSNAIRMFGIKYGGIIIDNGYSAAAIVKASEINASYDSEVSKGISIYKSIRNNEYGVRFADEDVEVSDANGIRVLGGYNKIYYGAPGCGKSFIVNKKLDDANVPEENRIRVTFHPEYANCDFVGQILPTIEKKIDSTTGEEKEVVKYIFNAGPFTLALERARKTNDMVYLIIEEINRGNAAAIFGDLFQLLDREKDMTKPNWGESEYPICNVNIQKYLGMDEGKSTVIPSNLTILATMNTSDQSVFTLDTAFKRRWSFEQISNNIEKDIDHKYKGWYVPGTNVTLEKFLTVINAEILKHKITSEDKRMGKYFISKDCLTEIPCDIQDVKMEAEMFAYKVLEYIWNDVCKIGKDEWFDTVSITTLEDLIDAFVEPSSGETPLSVFKSITF